MSENLSVTSNNSPPPPDLFGDIIGKILGSQIQAGDGADGVGGDAQNNIGTSPGGSQSPAEDIFSSLLSNPELLVKLPSIISAAKPIIELFSQSHKESVGGQAEIKEVAAMSTNTSSHSADISHPTRHETACRTALLCAMKPYLSSDRQNAIDYIVKLSRLGDILKTL